MRCQLGLPNLFHKKKILLHNILSFCGKQNVGGKIGEILYFKEWKFTVIFNFSILFLKEKKKTCSEKYVWCARPWSRIAINPAKSQS